MKTHYQTFVNGYFNPDTQAMLPSAIMGVLLTLSFTLKSGREKHTSKYCQQRLQNPSDGSERLWYLVH